MHIRKARQILRSFADDTRLRIINLLNKESLNVAELCEILEKKQSIVSKHLMRLRLTEIAADKRKGFNVYYRLVEPPSKEHKELLGAVTFGLAGLETFKRDLNRLNRLNKTSRKKKEG